MYSDRQHHQPAAAVEQQVDLLQAYVRSQAELVSRPHRVDWFHNEDREELIDDGDHPLLAEQPEPDYSQTVLKRSYATWRMLLDKNYSYKVICNYYHMLEKMGETSPPHIREFVRKSLEVTENIDEIYQIARTGQADRQNMSLSTNHQVSRMQQNHDPTPSTAYEHLRVLNNLEIQQNHDPIPAYEHPRVLNNLEIIRQLTSTVNDRALFHQKFDRNHEMQQLQPSYDNLAQRNGPFSNHFAHVQTNGSYEAYDSLCNTLASNFHKNYDYRVINERAENSPRALNRSEIMCQSQMSIESTPSKSSEADSCYQSMASPSTEADE